MRNVNLLVRFTMAGAAGSEVRGAARIVVDGRGGLVVYDPATGAPERIALAELESLRIDRAVMAMRAGSWVN